MFQDILKIFEYRFMLYNTVKKELRARYKGSFLGFFWTFLNPLLMLVIYSIIFATIMKVSVPGYNYALFLFVGLVPWTFFATTLQQSTTTIVSNSNLIKKIYFPRLILPLTVTATNLVNMLLTFIIVFVALLIFKAPITWLYLYLPLIIIAQTILVLGFSVILSAITVYFRDLEHIISVIMIAWFYLTPIVYPINYIPEKYLALFELNPMVAITNSYRNILMFNRVPERWNMIYICLFSATLIIIGYFLFDKLQKRFAEEV